MLEAPHIRYHRRDALPSSSGARRKETVGANSAESFFVVSAFVASILASILAGAPPFSCICTLRYYYARILLKEPDFGPF